MVLLIMQAQHLEVRRGILAVAVTTRESIGILVCMARGRTEGGPLGLVAMGTGREWPALQVNLMKRRKTGSMGLSRGTSSGVRTCLAEVATRQPALAEEALLPRPIERRIDEIQLRPEQRRKVDSQ